MLEVSMTDAVYEAIAFGGLTPAEALIRPMEMCGLRPTISNTGIIGDMTKCLEMLFVKCGEDDDQ